MITYYFLTEAVNGSLRLGQNAFWNSIAIGVNHMDAIAFGSKMLVILE
jgi:hypothetical protein